MRWAAAASRINSNYFFLLKLLVLISFESFIGENLEITYSDKKIMIYDDL